MLVYEYDSNVITVRKIGERVFNDSSRRVTLDDEKICLVCCPLTYTSEQKSRHRIFVACIGELDAEAFNATDRSQQ